MRYGLLTYGENKRNFNIGDYIQSLAARQFLPQVDVLVNREQLADFQGEKTKVILNGWFTHNCQNWIPSDGIEPLFISFHINNTAAPFMLSPKGIAYLKQHQPIGCRDQYTASILNEKGIEAYFSGCLTTTLSSYRANEEERGDDIYIVDPLYGYPTSEKVFYDYKRFLRSLRSGALFQLQKRNKHLRKIIDSDLLKNATYVNQVLPAGKYSEEEKFTMAEKLLHKYARAKFVVTSRIHCALPCLAIGTPVVFINGFDSFVDSCRFEGLVDLFNRVDVNPKNGDTSSNFALNGKINDALRVEKMQNHLELARKMKEQCSRFIAGSPIP